MPENNGRTRVAVTIIIDLDPVPGAFHTPESARQLIEGMILNAAPHYNPVVILEPESGIR